jgi:hypothetical protein
MASLPGGATMADQEASIWIKLKDGVSDSLGKIKHGFGELMNDFAGTGMIAVSSIAAAFALLKKSLDEAAEAQQTQAETARITEQVGTAAGWTAKQIEEMSEKLSESVAIDDDAIQAGINLLATHTNLSDKSMPKVAAAAADLAAKQNNGKLTAENYTAAVQQLAGALESPQRGMMMLQRELGGLDDAEKAQINTLIKHGDVEKARAALLDAVIAKTKGAAEQTGTWNYALRQASTEIMKLVEGLGKFLLPIATIIIETLTGLVKSIGNVIGAVSNFSLIVSDVMTRNFKAIVVHHEEMKKNAVGIVDTWKKSGSDIATTWENMVKSMSGAEDKKLAKTKSVHKTAIAEEKKVAADILAIQKKYHADADAAKKDYDLKIVQLENAKGKDISQLKRDLDNDLKMQDEATKVDQMVRDKKYDELRHKSAMDLAEQRIAIAEQEAEAKKKSEVDMNGALDVLSGIQKSKNKTAWEVGKQASVIQTGITTYEAAMKAFSAMASIPYVGPVLGALAAATVTGFGLEQVANIESQSFPSAHSGGYIPNQGSRGAVRVADDTSELMMPLDNPTAMSKLRSGLGMGDGQQQINLVMDKATIQRWSVANSQQQYRLKKEGRLS